MILEHSKLKKYKGITSMKMWCKLGRRAQMYEYAMMNGKRSITRHCSDREER
jgi:hypothetical protein